MPSVDLSTIFAALADPTRRAILARLSEGAAPVKDLVEPFELSGPAITKHLKVLERAGLISRSREGRERPCRLEPRALAPAADWIEQYRAMWEEQLDRLESYLKSVSPPPPRRAHETKTDKSIGKKPKTKTPRGGRHGSQR
ncbi:MAG: helix-turn-helix transcriptional regulator [Labilithrix sp.]|nr:helix-turn-helix transcriptional regulator [Labilithrix sp.]